MDYIWALNKGPKLNGLGLNKFCLNQHGPITPSLDLQKLVDNGSSNPKSPCVKSLSSFSHFKKAIEKVLGGGVDPGLKRSR